MSHKLVSLYIGDGEYYTRIDADNVIADLEESHKKEVEQLLIEIAKLKQQIEVLQKEKKIIQDLYIGERNDCRIWAARAIHNKYKRCLAMAMWCAAECVVNQNTYKRFLTHKSEFRIGHFRKWYLRWLAIAEKFKTNSTAQ